MSEPTPAVQDETLSARFIQLVLQQTNMALMLLGKIANPNTGETMRDLEAARFFIDQLEMLEAKTRGNLGPEEIKLLQQTLMTLRMAYVEAVNSPPSAAANPPAAPPGEDEASAGRRFTKKY